MGISPDPCCAHCYNIPVGSEVGESLLTISASGSDCECINVTALPVTSYTSGTRQWNWCASPIGGVGEPYPGGWLLHYDNGIYYYAGPMVSISCITSGENRGHWQLNIQYYLPKDDAYTPFTGPLWMEAILPCDAIEINSDGCLTSPEPVNFEATDETGGCTVTLNWTGC